MEPIHTQNHTNHQKNPLGLTGSQASSNFNTHLQKRLKVERVNKPSFSQEFEYTWNQNLKSRQIS